MFNQDLLRTITVLYVEDEERIRLTMYNVFVKLFKKVYVAVDGKDGFELYKEIISKDEEIDIVVADINMPVMSGIEATQIIREKNKTIPIIALTAAILDDEKRKYLNAGMNDVLEKPLNIENLKSILNKYLNDKTVSK